MRRFFECLIPNSTCNLECSYCYLIQQGRRKQDPGHYQYSAEIIGKSLSQKRLGGVSLISMTAQGETLLSKELPDITREILKQGHFVNITTNGTITNRFDILLKETQGFHNHLHFSFSFHYNELKKRNLLDTFFKNIQKVRDAGCSILLQINLVDEYIPHWNEIKRLALEHTGALPQVALTRDENNNTYKPMTKLNFENYKRIGRGMQSPLFEFTCKNFMVKRKEFCYAGYWSATLDMASGILTGCYGNGFKYNIFAKPNEPIPFKPIGRNCTCKYCINSSHFLSQGCIPSILPLPSYGELRNREEANWYTKEMRDFLYKQFEDVNPKISKGKKAFFATSSFFRHIPFLFRKIIFKLHFRNAINKITKTIHDLFR